MQVTYQRLHRPILRMGTSGSSECNRLVSVLLVMCLVSLESSCCKHFSAEVAREDEAAQNWLHPWSGQYDWKSVPVWRSVPESKMAQAATFLHGTAILALSESQAVDLVGESSMALTAQSSPYLVRAIGPARGPLPLQVFVRPTGDVWVGGEAISRCSVPKERRAVVVWLSKAPGEVFVTFSIAK